MKAFRYVIGYCSIAIMLPITCAFVPELARSMRPSMDLGVHRLTDADQLEQLVGGERYQVTPLPDSMLETTIFVGNLNEFVTDDDLSRLFAVVSEVTTPPAAISRKPSMQSLMYGFVAFCTEEEAQAAILRFHGTVYQGKNIKVEPILDHPKRGRVKVPEKLVAYVSGECKLSNGRVNTLRRISRNEQNQDTKKKKKKKNKSRAPKLDASERAALERAYKHGFVTVSQQTCGLQRVHADVCRKLNAPQISHCKAKTRNAGASVQLDTVWINFGTLMDIVDQDPLHSQMDQAASNTGMMISGDMEGESSEIKTFVGDRSQSKSFCRELANLWDLPQETEKKERRKRRGGHRQAYH